MAMKLAFSTVACPDWTISQVIEKARQMGYEGVELRTFGSGSCDLACDPALSDSGQVRRMFEQSGVEAVCLSTSVAMHHRDSTAAARVRQQCLDHLEMASEVGCSFLRVFGYEVSPGRDRRSVIQHMAQQILPIVEKASELGVQILFENAGSFNKAKEWWWLFNLTDHPMVGMCWNVANAAAAGEPSAVSVPCLNSRIRLAKVKDTRVGEGSGFVPLGEGTVGVDSFVTRLAGIGFDGFVSVEWDRLWLPALAPAEEFLSDAVQRLRGWLEATAKSSQKGFSDAAPMNKELKKLLDAAQKKREPAKAISS